MGLRAQSLRSSLDDIYLRAGECSHGTAPWSFIKRLECRSRPSHKSESPVTIDIVTTSQSADRHVAGRWVDLRHHPSKPTATVRAVGVFVDRTAELELQMTFRVEGDIPRVQILPPGAVSMGVDLWRHTCFEAFIAIEGEAAYHEFNFAPSGQWAVYELRGYRDGHPLTKETLAPRIVVRSTSTSFELDASVRLNFLSDAYARAPLRIGLSAVIEASDGISYWALRHPRDKPDFHDADGFALRLDPRIAE